MLILQDSQPLISVVIPCYNTDQFIGEAIASALNQTYPNVEIIVVDDGSSDRSLEVIQSFGDRIRFDSINHRGACAARNRGLELSKGEYIQFLDADDLLLPTKLERQVPLLTSGEADLVFCKGYIFGDGRPTRPKKSQIESPVGIDPFVYCLNQGLSTEGPLHRRSGIEKVGRFTEGLLRAQEYDLHLRLAATNIRLRLLNEHLYKHRNHDNSSRITKSKLSPDHLLQLFLDLETRLMAGEPYEMSKERVQALASKIFQHSIYAFRNGCEETALEGFDRARKRSKKFDYAERSWYKGLANFVHPLYIERFLNQGRMYRELFLKS
ncbi:glycosyltransferase family 2 protein [Oculatella sp. LEGE 06141]|uniref:glycosyltransferase family 2 protein n=1 Tax=Oculatella sp. LEGE 06141 TaxID=1828648 RepID=UPI00187E89B3|nr:glycosyltransferase family 2 protein [Oculatella sp. LEGE 06141]MBE9179511.1 glycosyltransferase family 2 protein [Oculatella sp. LEGE 06141]